VIACATAYFTGLVYFTRKDYVIRRCTLSVNKLNYSKIHRVVLQITVFRPSR